MKNSEINIRDPFVLLDGDTYYLYGSRGNELWGKCTGLDVYVGKDLENWSEPKVVFEKTPDFWADRHFWAPEVHKYNGEYYMFVSFKSASRQRGTQILKADSPLGPFLPHSDGPLTPAKWSCLDGTFWVENGKLYMVFCHEWSQIGDGTICALELSEDLKEAVGEPKVLFKASDAPWISGFKGAKELNEPDIGYVTDGPFMFRTQNGRLLMLWSSFSKKKYCEAFAYSDNGSLFGNWSQDARLLMEDDGGHGMVFRDRQGRLYFVCHTPNVYLEEKPCFIPIEEKNDSLYRK